MKKVNELLTRGKMLRFAHSSMCTIRNIADRFTKVLSQDLKCLRSKSTAVLSE